MRPFFAININIINGKPLSWQRKDDTLVRPVLLRPSESLTLNSSSSVIEDVKGICRANPLSGYAYFFFDSRNADKGLILSDNLLRSLLSQLSSRCGGIPAALKESFEAHGAGREQPSTKSLQDTLQLVLDGFDQVYIMIDSLDECGERAELLRVISTMADWKSRSLHLLMTSRPEPEITTSLDLIPKICTVRINGSVLDTDLNIYLDEQLSSQSRWSEKTRQLVKATLIEGADGMCVVSPFNICLQHLR